MLTLNELIEELTELREEMAHAQGTTEDEAGEAKVKVAHQPSYPLEGNLDAVTALEARPDVIFLASGECRDYAPSDAWEGGFVEDESTDEEGL